VIHQLRRGEQFANLQAIFIRLDLLLFPTTTQRMDAVTIVRPLCQGPAATWVEAFRIVLDACEVHATTQSCPGLLMAETQQT
jgi:hypothetical protein